jgi:hypothetical protein
MPVRSVCCSLSTTTQPHNDTSAVTLFMRDRAQANQPHAHVYTRAREHTAHTHMANSRVGEVEVLKSLTTRATQPTEKQTKSKRKRGAGGVRERVVADLGAEDLGNLLLGRVRECKKSHGALSPDGGEHEHEFESVAIQSHVPLLRLCRGLG